MCLAAIQQETVGRGQDMSIETEAVRACCHPRWVGWSLEELEGVLVFW